MNPGEVTTVIMKFDLPTLPACHGRPTEPPDRRPRVRLALPHPGARGARHDAAPGRGLTLNRVLRIPSQTSAHLRRGFSFYKPLKEGKSNIEAIRAAP